MSKYPGLSNRYARIMRIAPYAASGITKEMLARIMRRKPSQAREWLDNCVKDKIMTKKDDRYYLSEGLIL